MSWRDTDASGARRAPHHGAGRRAGGQAPASAPPQIFDENGNDLGVLDVPTGGIFSLKVEGDEIEVLSEPGKGMRVPARHSALNVGTTPYWEVLVEYK